VKIAWDPVAAMMAGEDVLDGARLVAPHTKLLRLYGVRSAKEAWLPVEIDQGEVDVEAQIRTLRKSGFEGSISCEVRAEPRSKTGLRDCTYLHQVVSRIKRG